MSAKRRIKRLGLALAGGVLVGLIALTHALITLHHSALVDAQARASSQTPVITVAPGASFAEVATDLADRGLLEQPLLLRLWARWRGYAERLHVGDYALSAGLSATDLVKKMARGEIIESTFTIIEGWTVAELLAAIRAHPDLARSLDPAAGPQALMAAIGRPGQPAEGQFLPETYHFPKGSDDIELLKRANRALEQALEAAWQARQPNLPLSNPQDALTLASIIEKETALASERRRISGVFTRRLQQGMRLQTDPTVIYGLGADFDGDLRRRDLRTDTPWNTYTRSGLPPTPIALAGIASIRAAVNPAEGDSLYFVSRGDGSHVFSATLAAHNAAVRRYQLGIEDD